jgi:hypothetical protein
MRLTEEQRNIIREAGLRHFGVIPHLFGSCLNDAARCGNIDLFIPGDWSPAIALLRGIASSLGGSKNRCGGENKSTPSSILNQALHHGQPV